MYDVALKLELAKLSRAIEEGAREGLQLGADLVAVEAKGLAPQRTGQLANSIEPTRQVTGSLLQDDLETGIGAGAPYSVFVEFGTGIHGPKGQPYFVKPTRRKALRFPVPGGFAFSRGHWVRGSRARPYIQPAVDNNREAVAESIAQGIENAISQAFER